jgi:prepilin-type N-terminal cleavage/methylation domain-containing protein
MRLRLHRRDAGFSLVELLVTITISTVLGALLTGVVISTLRTSAGTRARVADLDSARVAMDSMTRNLRTAIAPAQLGASCTGCTAPFLTFTAAKPLAPCGVTFWANLGNAAAGQVDRPVKFSYVLEPAASGLTADLVEYRQQPDGPSGVASSWTGATVRRVLINGIVYNAAKFGSGTGCATGTPTAPIFQYYTAAGAPTTDVSAVRSIDINLPVRSPNALENGTTTANTRVFLPNTAWGS